MPEAFPRHASARVMHRRGPREQEEGAGNAGCWPQPMARQQTKKLAAVTTGPAESSGIPCATVLTLMAYSPRGPGFLAPVIARLVTAGDLTSASGGQDH